MSQEEEYEEDFAAKYDGVFAGEADGDDDESEGDEEDYGDEFEGAEPAMPDPRAEDVTLRGGFSPRSAGGANARPTCSRLHAALSCCCRSLVPRAFRQRSLSES